MAGPSEVPVKATALCSYLLRRLRPWSGRLSSRRAPLEEPDAQRRRFFPAPAPPPPRDIITPRMKPKSYQFPLLKTS